MSSSAPPQTETALNRFYPVQDLGACGPELTPAAAFMVSVNYKHGSAELLHRRLLAEFENTVQKIVTEKSQEDVQFLINPGVNRERSLNESR